MKSANESLSRPAQSLSYKLSRRSWTEILICCVRFNRKLHRSFTTSGWIEKAVSYKRMHRSPRFLFYSIRGRNKRCLNAEVSNHRSHCRSQWCLRSNSCNFLRRWGKLVWLALGWQLGPVAKVSKRHVRIHRLMMRYTHLILCVWSTLDALFSRVVSATFHSRNNSRWHQALSSLITDQIHHKLQPTDSFLIPSRGLQPLLNECTQWIGQGAGQSK